MKPTALLDSWMTPTLGEVRRMEVAQVRRRLAQRAWEDETVLLAIADHMLSLSAATPYGSH